MLDFKKLGIVILVIVFVLGSLSPAASYMVKQGFKQPTKPWAENTVIRGARIHMLMMNYSTARPTFEQALGVFPRSVKRPDIIYWVAFCYEKEENYKSCKEWYHAFINAYPQHRWIDQAKRRLAQVEAIQN